MSRLNEERRYELAVALAGPARNRMRITQYYELLEGGHVEEYRVRHMTTNREDLKPLVEDYVLDCRDLEAKRMERRAKKPILTANDWKLIDQQDSGRA